jgi:hypothetical protein
MAKQPYIKLEKYPNGIRWSEKKSSGHFLTKII